jgi:predicted Mrr-cat superfamily restriction endonuclease
MTKVWCVRADGGRYAEHFVHGGYAAIGWEQISQDLSFVGTKDELYDLVRQAYPSVRSPIVIGNYVGQIARFLLEMAAGDYVITPAADAEWLYYGQVGEDPSLLRVQWRRLPVPASAPGGVGRGAAPAR